MRSFSKLLLLLTATLVSAPAGAAQYTIAYTGETHALLEPCECPVRPSGGVARRATAVERTRKRGLNPTLLVDCGGAFAGGFYDEYTLGPVVDRERTLVALEAMRAMKYDAIAVGDEELLYGRDFLLAAVEAGTPFVSANLLGSDGTPLLPSHVIREVEGARFALIGVTTLETFLFDNDRLPEGFAVDDPVTRVADAVREVRGDVDIVVVLSHLGEVASRELLQSVEGIDVLLNAHRLAPGGARYLSDYISGAVYANFSYQGRAMGRVDLMLDDQSVRREHRVWEMELGDEVPADPALDALVAGFNARLEGDLADQALAVVDVYMQTQCPHCRAAEPEIEEAVQAFGADRARVRRHYVLHRGRDGTLESGTEPAELAESRRQAAIETLHAQALPAYMAFYRDNPLSSFDERAAAAGLDAEALRAAVEEGVGLDRLYHGADLARRFGINLTPTVMVNNRPVNADSGVTRDRMVAALCHALPGGGRPPACAGLPECIDDSDCTQPGKIGACVTTDGRAHCEFTDLIEVTLTVITSPEVRFTDPSGIVSPLMQFVPGLRVRTLDADSEEGLSILEAANAQWLPALFLDGAIEATPQFDALRGGLIPVADGLYQLAPYSVGGSLDVTRAPQRGRLDLFMRPLDVGALEAAKRFVQQLTHPRAAEAFDLHIRFLLYRGEEGALAAPGGPAEVEEAMRQAYILRHHSEAFPTYLTARAEVGNSSYWDVPLRQAGLDPDTVRGGASAQEFTAQLTEDAALREELGIDGPLTLLVENRELTQLTEEGATRAEAAALSLARVDAVLDRLGAAANSLTICYAGHIDGRLESCGCDGSPFGGILRMAGALRQVRSQAGQVVFLSAGDMFPAQPDIESTTALLKVLETMQVDALGVGDQEFSLGSQLLLALSSGSPLTLVSTNVTAGGQPIAAPSAVIERGLVRVGVIAVLSPSAFALDTASHAEGLQIAEPIAAAAEAAHELRGRVDVLVALSHLGAEGDEALARSVPEIDVVIGAHTGRALHAALDIDGRYLVEAGGQGTFLGVLHLRLDEGKVVGAANRLVALDESAPEDEEVRALVEEHKAAQAEAFAAVRAASEALPTELRAGACGECHTRELAAWEQTGHARAVATLASVNQDNNPACWTCHSTGAPGYEARLAEVQCLACHDVGPIEDGAHTRVTQGPVQEAACLPCHTPSRSPSFVFGRYREFVTH